MNGTFNLNIQEAIKILDLLYRVLNTLKGEL